MMQAKTTSNDRLKRLVDICDYLIDEKVGIIESVTEIAPNPGAPRFFHYYGKACNTQAFVRQENFFYTGGAATDRGMAMAKAIGEGVERYCAAIYDREEFPLYTRKEAPFRCAEPQSFVFYTDEQLSQPDCVWVKWTEDTPVRWVRSVDILTGEAVHVPAPTVVVPYYFYVGEETETEQGTAKYDAPICQPISTGLACHCSYEEAILSGLNEMIERDAFTIAWQAMVAPPQILAETLSDENYDRVERFERAGGKVFLFDITTDVGIPTILSVLENDAVTEPALVFAAASSIDPEDAALNALEELAHTRRYSYLIMSKMPPLVSRPPRHENVRGQEDHLNFWADHSNRGKAEFLFRSKRRIEFDEIENCSTGDVKEDLRRTCEKVQSVGLRVLVADLTTPDIRPLGLRVVHTVVPGFHPLFMGHMNRSLAGRRLWEVPQKLGYEGIRPETGDNPWPHPYP